MRLFVAIELSPDMLRGMQKVQRALGDFGGMLRWTDAEQMHVTLKFLGELPDGDVPQVTSALTRAANQCGPFTLRTQTAGCFPPRGKVRIIWAGLSADDDALMRCQHAVESCLAEAGYPPEERPYSPHLTLGRVRDDRSGGALRDRVAAVVVPAVHQEVQTVSLMQSQLRSSGAEHTRMATFALAARDA